MTTAWPLPVRLRGVLRSPRATFEALAAAPRWADVLVVTSLAAASTTALVLETDIGRLALVDHLDRTATALGRPLDNGQYAALQETGALGTAYAVVTALINGPVLAAALSALLVGVLRPGAGSSVTYRQVLAVVSHAGVILALRQLMAAPLTYARETLASPLTFATVFTLLDETSPLSRFAGMVDVFVVWWIVVLATGVSVLYRRPAARVAVTFTGVYIVLAALAALAVAITGGSA